MNKLGNYISGRWIEGDGDGQLLSDAVTGKPLYRASAAGIDLSAAVNYARNTGNPALRRMTFPQRGLMLKALATHLTKSLPLFYDISYQTGATRSDSWIDLEGGLGNLFSYASLRRKFPDQPFCLDGDAINLSKRNTFMGQHLLVPKEGVAVHINAYNFPVWGMLEKIAVNLLAGVPAIVKPATVTSFLTEAVVREIIASQILPAGSLQLVCGSAGNLLDLLTAQDVVTFTGSAVTGLLLKSNLNLMRENVPFTMEADSLNCIVLAPDAIPGTPEWDLFIKEIRKEMTVKAGQKCTAIRRIFIPESLIDAAQIAIGQSLTQTTIGNPRNEKVRMGALAGQDQRKEVRSQVQKLLASSSILYGSLDSVQLLDADNANGAFISPLLLLNQHPFTQHASHEVEAFGPVSTIMPYRHFDEAIELSKRGKGSLCSTIVTADSKYARQYVVEAATHHGRILILDRSCAAESTGHGSPLPQLVHGGPGRAGGGEEMGGVRGVKHYMQRVAVQGSPTAITAVTGVYQPHADILPAVRHPFTKYFEELLIGETLVTHKRTITSADISNFANISWDHFYAHTDHTALEGTIFTAPVAHGYFILSAAAGLFVDAAKGPVLLNYGIEECRFVKPVYAGTTIGVRLTCKEKISQELKEDDDIPKGIVKWYVEVSDDTGEPVMVATILTMIRRKNKN